jgi:hypothetical protein
MVDQKTGLMYEPLFVTQHLNNESIVIVNDTYYPDDSNVFVCDVGLTHDDAEKLCKKLNDAALDFARDFLLEWT